MRRYTAALVFLALLAGFVPPPAHAFFGIGVCIDPTKPFMIAELGKILTEVQRLKKIVAQAKASYEFLKMQKYRLTLGIQMLYWSPSALTILTGRACLAATWDPVFNADIGGRQIDWIYNTIRRAGEVGCADAALLSEGTRKTNALIGALELVTANGMNTVAMNSTNSSTAKTHRLLEAIAGNGDGEGATTDAQKLAAANVLLATQADAATAIQAEHLTMSTLRAQRVRDQLAAHVNSQLLRQRTHAGTFAGLQER